MYGVRQSHLVSWSFTYQVQCIGMMGIYEIKRLQAQTLACWKQKQPNKAKRNERPVTCLFVVRWRIHLILPGNFLAVDVMLDFRHQRLHELAVATDQGDGVLLLAPAGVTTNLNIKRICPSCKICQVRCDGALGERRAEQEPVDPLTLGVRQPRQQTWFEMFQESLEKTRHTRENVDVAIDHGNGHPHVVCDEDGLLFIGQGWVVRKFNHAQFRGEARWWSFPVEMGLHWMWTGEFLHPLKGGLVQFQLQAECLGYRFVCDIIVATKRKCKLSAACTRKQIWIYGRWPNASTGHDKVIVVAHASDSFDDFTLIIWDDFNALQLDSEREAVFSKEGGVGVNCLCFANRYVNLRIQVGWLVPGS